MVDSTEKQMLYATFNQDGSCFALGTESGFAIYSSSPFKDNFYRDLKGGIGLIEMLERSNTLALVGGGANPKFDSNTVIIWDDHQGKVMSELRFSSLVRRVKLKRDKIFIVTERSICVIAFASMTVIEIIDTCYNPSGIIAVTQEAKTSVIAYPGKEPGCVMVKNYSNEGGIMPISAHQTKLSCLALNSGGSLLATCSEMGTFIRLYNTADGNLIKELRRGSERAEVYSLSFDSSSKYLACSSNRRKVYVFSCEVQSNTDNDVEKANDVNGDSLSNKSVFKKLSFFFQIQPNLNTEIAFSQFKLDDDKAICCFGKDLNLFVISSGGKYFHITFDPKQRGDCKLLNEKDLLNSQA